MILLNLHTILFEYTKCEDIPILINVATNLVVLALKEEEVLNSVAGS